MWGLIKRDLGEFVTTLKDDAAGTLKAAISFGEDVEVLIMLDDVDQYTLADLTRTEHKLMSVLSIAVFILHAPKQILTAMRLFAPRAFRHSLVSLSSISSTTRQTTLSVLLMFVLLFFIQCTFWRNCPANFVHLLTRDALLLAYFR